MSAVGTDPANQVGTAAEAVGESGAYCRGYTVGILITY